MQEKGKMLVCVSLTLQSIAGIVGYIGRLIVFLFLLSSGMYVLPWHG